MMIWKIKWWYCLKIFWGKWGKWGTHFHKVHGNRHMSDFLKTLPPLPPFPPKVNKAEIIFLLQFEKILTLVQCAFNHLYQIKIFSSALVNASLSYLYYLTLCALRQVKITQLATSDLQIVKHITCIQTPFDLVCVCIKPVINVQEVISISHYYFN